jgi:PAS domain S-box-containing protein
MNTVSAFWGLLTKKDNTAVQSATEKEMKNIEEALFESEQRFQLIAENVQKGILIIDKDASISFTNSFMAKMLGYTDDEMIGTDASRYFDDISSKIIAGELKKKPPALIEEREISFINRDGIKIPTIIQTTILFDLEKRNIGILAEVQHTYSSKKVESKLFEKLNRLQKSELATLNIMEDLQETIVDLQKAKEEINQKNKELQTINTELNVIKNQLAFLNKDLETEVKKRTAEVEMLLKQKDDFINQLGHDLKTPLTPLNTLLPLIKQREHDAKLLELLDICINNVNFMRNLVNKTLELAQLNTKSTFLDVEDIMLYDEVNEVLQTKKLMFLEKNVTISNNISRQLIVQVDVIQIKELFDNIIVNAVKYSAPLENQITIDAKDEGDQVIVSIKDNGIGLTSEQLEHLFHEFYKADMSRHYLDSTGLGLSICKRIVEKHGGKIWAESPGLGKGSTFYFTLPTTKKKSNNGNNIS